MPGTSFPLDELVLPGADEPDGPLPGRRVRAKQLNFEAGENVLLKLEPTARFTKFLVTGPDPKTKPRPVPSPSNDFLEVVEPAATWALDGQGDRGRRSARRCWASASTRPRAESQFDPLEKPRPRHHLRQGQLQAGRGRPDAREDRDDRPVRIRDLSLADVPRS